MPWIYLMVAIVLEVMGTTNLKQSDGFSRPWPSLLVAIGYGGAFYLLSLCVKEIELGVAYAVWSGVGTTLVAVVGLIAFGEVLTWSKILCIGLILIGTTGLHMLSLGR